MVLLCLVATQVAFAQPEFYMRDTTVTDCEGVLYDSELGQITGHYDHNEDYTFTICITGADDILLDFNYFHTEIYDEITFYDGPDVSAPLISGPYSGRTMIPTIVASSGCLTIHFTSDANVAEPGWRATWRTSNFEPPTPPAITLVNTPSCPMTELIIESSRPIHCDSLYAGAFSLRGPKIVAITGVDPLNCMGDSATQFRVRFAPPLDFSGRYRLTMRTIIPYCTTPYVLFSELPFTLTGCPLAIRLLVFEPDRLCEGGFTRVTAEVSGGIFGTYQYTWSPYPSGVDTVRAGPINGPTTVSVSVVDAAGNTANASIDLIPATAPVITGGDRSMCQSVDPFLLEASPPFGTWEADGMYYGYDRYQRLYDPLLTDGNSDIITYTAPNGCSTSVTYTFTPLDMGTDDGACPGAPPFLVSGGQPRGGTWSGPNIAGNGRFTPPADTGTWTVTYTHPNGCSGSKEINVAFPTGIAQDTFCESEPRIELEILPRGGVWTGPGVVFGSRGWFSPGAAGPGPHTLTYIAEGCGDRQIDIFVKEIDAFEGFTACPSEDPRILPGNWRPAGGTWYGRGIIEPSDGLFDPGIFGEGSDTLTYLAPNGCTDRRSVSVFYTFTRPENDTLTMCTADDPMQLSPGGRFFQRPLDVGIWQGVGVRYTPDSIAVFDPRIAGVGIHQIEYLANTCSAYNWVQVGQSPEWYGDTICFDRPPVQFVSAAAQTQWNGPGIINGVDGIFDPASSGAGFHTVSAFSAEGCRQDAQVWVPADEQLEYTPPAAVACFSESEIDIGLLPTTARMTLGGASIGPRFSTADLGEGFYSIQLAAGAPGCEDLDSFSLEVLPPLSLSAKPYTANLCEGDGTRLEVEAEGGLMDSWNVRWNDRPNWPILSRQVQPTQSTVYRATLSDGCSDSVTVLMPITVNPAVRSSVEEGPIVCHYDSTYSIVTPLGSSNYEVRWYVPDGPQLTEEYVGAPGFYDVEITDLATNCQQEIEVRLPGYEPIVASFSPNPSECIEPTGTVVLLDRSRGATRGVWQFSDGTEQVYVEGVNPSFSFADTGRYEIKLLLENDGGCTSRDSLFVCVDAPSRLFLPNAFTPNGDDLNDTYQMTGLGIYDIEWVVVDRWGTLVHFGSAMDDGWDGTYKGEALPPGEYTLRIKYTDSLGKRIERQGFFLLVR